MEPKRTRSMYVEKGKVARGRFVEVENPHSHNHLHLHLLERRDHLATLGRPLGVGTHPAGSELPLMLEDYPAAPRASLVLPGIQH